MKLTRCDDATEGLGFKSFVCHVPSAVTGITVRVGNSPVVQSLSVDGTQNALCSSNAPLTLPLNITCNQTLYGRYVSVERSGFLVLCQVKVG